VIVVDTSVWVAATRSPRDDVATRLASLIDADEACLALPVRLELMAGLGRQHRAAFRRSVTALPIVRPTDATWAVVERWVDEAADAGHRFGLSDLLIAALAHELTALVWSLDADFKRMAALGFVQTY
jgi:predicted nucleic acid-binding protein